MRLLLASTCAIIIGLALVAASPGGETCALTLKLTDAGTGRALDGLIRIKSADGSVVTLNELLPRGLGLKEDEPIAQWSVLPKTATINVPATKLNLEAVSGLETETGTLEVNLTGKATAEVTIPLRRFYHAADRGFRSANTHLHLMKLAREQVDRYLLEIPKADGLDIVFLSYLERAVADREYTSNGYTKADLAGLAKQSGVGFGNGEEHRHNYGGGGQGYGHVMLLNIQKLIQPVSIGPGIMKVGTDGIPIQRGIDTARKDGATVVWCHNDWGLEDIANLVTGRLDAQNIFDGGVKSSFKHSFYRYLNAGFQVPFSTGTDWFIYDFSRVYVQAGKVVTPEQWLQALSAGKTYITNGPLLEFTVDGQAPGGNVSVGKQGRLDVVGRAWGRVDFGRIELVQNGKPIHQTASRTEGGHFVAEMKYSLDVAEPCWLALRTPPPPLEGDPELSEPVKKNLFGKDLFGHTSALFVDVEGRRYFDKSVAEGMLAEMKSIREEIAGRSNFADNQERSRVLDVYSDAITAMNKHMAKQSAN